MKLLFIDQSGKLYGSEKGLLTLIKELNHQNSRFHHQLTVACPYESTLWNELSNLNLSLESMQFNLYTWKERPDWHLNFIFQLIKIIKKCDPDAIVINFEGNVPQIVLACNLTRYPVIRMLKREVRANNSGRLGYKIRLLDKLSFRRCSGVICISGAVEKQLKAALCNKDLPPIYTLFDPQEVKTVSLDTIQIQRQNLGLKPHELLVGEFARINPVKGIDLLIRAAPLVLRKVSEVRFVIAGDVDNATSRPCYLRDLKKLAKELGVSDRFIWTGFVEDPLSLMAACDIITLPTRAEGLGRVLIEAWSVNRPVVASQVDGPEEVISLSGGGLLHPVDDHEALAAQLIKLLLNPEKRDALANMGRDWVFKNCSPQQYKNKFLEIVKACMSSKTH